MAVLNDTYLLCHNFILHTLASYHMIYLVILVLALFFSVSFLSRRRLNFLRVDGKAVLITGCDTGFGHALAKYLDSLGVIVFAGCVSNSSDGALWLKKNSSKGMHVLQVNVRDSQQIDAFLQYVTDHLPEQGLWGIVNNAGVNLLADTELTTMEQYARIIDINLMGYIRITKTFLPFIRRSKAYSITKFGGEVFSDILRLEMKKFGVNVSIIEPCSFGMATDCINVERIRQDEADMWEGMTEEQRKTYGREYVEQHLKVAEQRGKMSQGMSVQTVLDAMTDALFSSEPKVRYLIGGGTGWYDWLKVIAVLWPFLPQKLSDWLIIRRDRNFKLPAISS